MKPPHEWAAIGLARKLDGFSLERFVAEVQADAQSETPSLRDYFAFDEFSEAVAEIADGRAYSASKKLLHSSSGIEEVQWWAWVQNTEYVVGEDQRRVLSALRELVARLPPREPEPVQSTQDIMF